MRLSDLHDSVGGQSVWDELERQFDLSMTYHNKLWTVRFIQWGRAGTMRHYTGEAPDLGGALIQAYQALLRRPDKEAGGPARVESAEEYRETCNDVK